MHYSINSLSSSFETFGPIPSRRLGRSLGLNNIPPKFCSYSCVYCQVGSTLKMQVERQEFYKPAEIVKEVEEKVQKLRANKEIIDYLSFVPDGEPTLDINLGKEIELLKPLGIKIAVISNGSLIWQKEVREDLSKADWVSLKLDAASEEVWHKVNRPQKLLRWELIRRGMLEFAREYKGELTSETMLIRDINDSEKEVKKIADFLTELSLSKSYISIPIRPPAEAGVKPAGERAINMAYQIFSGKLDKVELLIGYEGDNFVSSGKVEEDLLSITSVHPMRKQAVERFLRKAGAKWGVAERLIKENKLKEVEYLGKMFYLRQI